MTPIQGGRSAQKESGHQRHLPRGFESTASGVKWVGVLSKLCTAAESVHKLHRVGYGTAVTTESVKLLPNSLTGAVSSGGGMGCIPISKEIIRHTPDRASSKKSISPDSPRIQNGDSP